MNGRRTTPRRSGPGPARRQSRFWNARYRSDPAFFGSGPSPFLRWVLGELRGHSAGPRWVELGAGYGRDAAFLRRRGVRVRGVEISDVGVRLARSKGADVIRGEVLEFLRSLPPAGADVVYSNLVLNMEFTTADHERIVRAIHRALAPGGFHAYSVRSVSDPWYGRGRRIGPAMFDLAPHGPVFHFFSRAYARRLRAGRFRLVRSVEVTEDPSRFPVRVLYVLERKLRTGPRRERNRRARVRPKVGKRGQRP